ncbi:MAG: ABC transporter permease [Chloroflexi bacterium]|nr:ABC transporter permease [Chloroflexota bacterium]
MSPSRGIGLSLRWNPVIIKELRARMRGARAFVILTGFLLLLGLFLYGLYQALVSGQRYWGGGAPLGAMIGRSLFISLALFELFVVCFITPALTSGAISGERERKTLDILLVTPLSPWSILWGKLVASLSYVLLLILAAVPMASLIFLFGGVTLADMLRALAILLLCALTFGVLGLFFSVWLRRSGRAMVASYVILLLLAVGVYFLYGVIGVVRQSEPPRVILLPSPVAAMASALGEYVDPGSFRSSGGALLPLVRALSGRFDGAPGDRSVLIRPLWHYTAGIYLVASLALFLASVWLLQPIRRRHLRPVEIVGLAVLVVALIAVGYGVYGPPSYERFGVLSRPRPTPAPPPMRAMPPPPVVVEKVIAVTPPIVKEGAAEEIQLPPGRSPEQLGKVYAAVVQSLIAAGEDRPESLSIYDTTGLGPLSDPLLDGSEPRRLPSTTLDVLSARVEERTGIPVAVVHHEEGEPVEWAGGEGEMRIGFGAPTWFDDGRVRVPVVSVTSSGAEEARICVLTEEEEDWVVAECGMLVREEKPDEGQQGQ